MCVSGGGVKFSLRSFSISREILSDPLKNNNSLYTVTVIVESSCNVMYGFPTFHLRCFAYEIITKTCSAFKPTRAEDKRQGYVDKT